MSNGDAVSAFSFQGRISRGPFWAVIGLTVLVIIVVFLVAGVMVPKGGMTADSAPNWLFAVLGLVYLLGFWVSFANYAKRLHDLDHSGWLSIALIIPLANLIMLIYCGAKEGTAGPNKYGAGPLKVGL